MKSWESSRRTPSPAHLDEAAARLGFEPAVINGRGDLVHLDLRGLRQATGLTVNAAARRLGIDWTTLRRVEAGEQLPPNPALIQHVYRSRGRALADAFKRFTVDSTAGLHE